MRQGNRAKTTTGDGTMRRMKLVGLAVLAALSFGSASAESLTDALVSAYRNSNLLDQNEALLRAADEDVAIAVSNLRPIIAFAMQAQYDYYVQPEPGIQNGVVVNQRVATEEFYGNAVITLDLTLLDFGRNRLAIDAAKETVLATREALVDLEQNVLYTAVQAYVNVRLRIEIVALRQSNVRLLGQLLQAANDRFDVGEITRTDVALAESRLAQSRAELATAEGDLMVARESYKAAIGNYPGTLTSLPRSPATANSVDEARAVAVRTHPALKEAQHQVTVSEINVARAKAETRPTLTGNVSVGYADRSINDPGADKSTDSVGLRFNQIIYAGGQLAAVYRRSLAAQEASKSALLQTNVIIEQNVGNAWSNLLVYQAQIEATDRQITAAQIAFDGTVEEARQGARTALDVLDAEQELLNARVDRVVAEAQRYLGVYALLQTMGLLTVDHLQLGIPSYDPTAYYNAVKNAPVHTLQGEKLDRIMKSIGEN
jgi:outer membrane protein